jgi:Putative Actinobacterial Holin-X, holin superfamily III
MGTAPGFQFEFQQLGHDLKNFIETRYEMLRAELSSSFARLRSAVVLFAVAAMFGVVGLILLGFCAACAIALGFGAFQNQVGLVWGFLITGGCALILAAIVGVAGKAALNPEELTPKHTLRVLKRDGESFRQAM